MGSRKPSTRQRRVVVKARFVSHAGVNPQALKAHVAYLAREGPGSSRADASRSEVARTVDYLSREGEEGTPRYALYDQAHDSIEGRALANAWAGDRRHFRLIISPEDGADLGDLRPFVRQLMGDLEQRLGTRLEWAAVDHWDTDNPHSHVLIRGRRADGSDLVIPRKIIAFEIRERAEAIVTRVLGPRPHMRPDIDRAREVATLGPTPLDREIRLAAVDGVVGARMGSRPDFSKRLAQLEDWGLVLRRDRGGWVLVDGLEAGLEAIGARAEARDLLERVDLLSPAHDVLAACGSKQTLGKLVYFGVADELTDRSVVVVEDLDGVHRFASFEQDRDLAALTDATRGALVELNPRQARLHPADNAVARIAAATGGLYSADLHARREPQTDPALLVANTRRLETMRRAGLIERRRDGVFEIATDHLDRALAFERERVAAAPLEPRVASWLTLSEQERAFGMTHLDRLLADENLTLRGQGDFAQEIETALQRRRIFLIEEGIMGPNDKRLSPGGVSRLTSRELSATARQLADELGLPVRTGVGSQTTGVYARRIDLAQGRMALIVSERSARLIPWRAPMERFAGREVEVLARGRSLSIGLSRGSSLPPM